MLDIFDFRNPRRFLGWSYRMWDGQWNSYADPVTRIYQTTQTRRGPGW